VNNVSPNIKKDDLGRYAPTIRGGKKGDFSINPSQNPNLGIVVDTKSGSTQLRQDYETLVTRPDILCNPSSVRWRRIGVVRPCIIISL